MVPSLVVAVRRAHGLCGLVSLSSLTALVAVSIASCSSSSGDSGSAGARSGADGSASGGASAGGAVSNAGGVVSNAGGTTSNGGAGNAAGASGTAGASAGGALNDAGIAAACGATPRPRPDPLPEPPIPNPDPTATLSQIVISGPSSTYATGGNGGAVTNVSVSLRDQGLYSDGTVRAIENLASDINYHSKVVWISSDPTVLGVASGDSRTAGGVQGFRAGTVTITVSYLGVSASVCFVVTPPVGNGLTIAPAGTHPSYGAPIVENPGDSTPLQCTESMTDGTTVDVTNEVTWASSVTSVATVSATGSTHALSGGTTIITATLPPSAPTINRQASTGTATLDVIGSTGLQQGASCPASGQNCAAGLSCCTIGRGGPNSCIPTPCPPPPPATP